MRSIAKRAQEFFQSLYQLLDCFLKEDGGKEMGLAMGGMANDGDGLEKKPQKPKEGKDPEAPKKPLTAFLLYCNYRRIQMKAIKPSTGYTTQYNRRSWRN